VHTSSERNVSATVVVSTASLAAALVRAVLSSRDYGRIVEDGSVALAPAVSTGLTRRFVPFLVRRPYV
jgi:hypothetical protein